MPASPLASLARLAARSWRLPLIVASVLFAVSGPIHSLGRFDTVFYASLVGVALGGIGVGLGYLALHADRAGAPGGAGGGDGEPT